MATLTGWAFLTAPLWLLTAWVIMWPLSGRAGPGAGWNLAHTAWIIGFVALGLACLELRRRAIASSMGSRLLPDAITAVILLGLVTGVLQMAVDLIAGFQTTSYDDMQARADEITNYPGVDFALYTLGPPLVFVGLFALFALIAVRRQTSALNPVLILLAFVVIGIAEDLTPLGLACLGLALAPIGWRLLRPAEARLGSTAEPSPRL